MKKLYKFLIFPFLLFPFISQGQDLGAIDKKDPVKVSGSISGTTSFYQSKGVNYGRPPFYWLLNGNLNFDIYGVNIPLSAMFSQQNSNFSQPFNQFGLSPRYKSVTIHAVYRSLNFSDYTLAGRIFLGVGVEAFI